MASGRVVGVVNLMEIVANPFFQGAYLGYHGMAALAGRGLMTEAVRLATAHAFKVLGAASARGQHPARQHALDRLGAAARLSNGSQL